MSRKYTPEFNAYARRVVKSFNQRVIRAEKRGLKNLPSLRKVRDLKAQFTTEEDLKKELASLREFNENRNALDQKLLGEETRLTNWEFNYIKDNLRELKQYYNREIEKAKERYANEPFDMAIRDDVLNLEQRRQYLDRDLLELNKSELATFRKYLSLYKDRNRTDQNFYDYYFESFDFLARVAGVPKYQLNSIKQQINSLTPAQFYEFYRSHSEMKKFLDYVPSPERAKYYGKLREYEQQVKDDMAEELGIDAKEIREEFEYVYNHTPEWVEDAKKRA